MLHSWLQFHKRKAEVVRSKEQDNLRLRGGGHTSPKVDLREDLRSIKQQQWQPRKTMGSPRLARNMPLGGHRQSIEYAPLYTKPC